MRRRAGSGEMNATRLGVAAAAMLGMLIGAPTIAAAQSSGETSTQPAAAPQERIITPRRSDGDQSLVRGDRSEGPVDWQAVKAVIDETRSRDAAYERTLRSMALTRAVSAEERERLRPKGLRSLSPTQLQRVDAARVAIPRLPVLAPVTAETAGSLRIAARDNAFTVFGELPDRATFELIGTRNRIVGGGPDAMKIRLAERRQAMKTLAAIDAPYTISHHEEGVDLSFSKFNVAYQIAVYCENTDDPRCAGDEYVVSLADNLVILNEDAGGAQ